jgi:hypothetical protein
MFTLLLRQRGTYFVFFLCFLECAKCCFLGCVPGFRTYSWWHVQQRQNGPMQSLFVRTWLTWPEGLRAEDLTSLFHACMRSDARVRRRFYIYMCIAWWHSTSKKESHHSNVTAHQPFCLSGKNLCMQIRGQCASKPAFLVFLCGLGVWRVYAQTKHMHQ